MRRTISFNACSFGKWNHYGKMEPSLLMRHIKMFGKWMQMELIQYVEKMEPFQYTGKMDRHEPNRCKSMKFDIQSIHT